MTHLRRGFLVLALTTLLAGCDTLDVVGLDFADEAASEIPESAEDFFEAFQDLEADYDPRLADLYADTAVIVIRTRGADGGLVTNTQHGADFKPQLRNYLFQASNSGDVIDYEDIVFERDGEQVIVTAQRSSEQLDFTAPYRQVLDPSPNTLGWIIVREEIQPTS